MILRPQPTDARPDPSGRVPARKRQASWLEHEGHRLARRNHKFAMAVKLPWVTCTVAGAPGDTVTSLPLKEIMPDTVYAAAS